MGPADRLAELIIAESALSFLGVGVPSWVPSWGTMINSAQQTGFQTVLQIAPHVLFAPGIAIDRSGAPRDREAQELMRRADVALAARRGARSRR